MRNTMIRLGACTAPLALRTSLLLALLAASLPGATAGDSKEIPRSKPEDVGISAERLERINEVIKRYVDDKKVSGAVTLVARKVSVHGLGTLKNKGFSAGDHPRCRVSNLKADPMRPSCTV